MHNGRTSILSSNNGESGDHARTARFWTFAKMDIPHISSRMSRSLDRHGRKSSTSRRRSQAGSLTVGNGTRCRRCAQREAPHHAMR